MSFDRSTEWFTLRFKGKTVKNIEFKSGCMKIQFTDDTFLFTQSGGKRVKNDHYPCSCPIAVHTVDNKVKEYRWMKWEEKETK